MFLPLVTILIMLCLGIVSYRKGIFSESQVEGFELLLFKIVVPAYLFAASYKHDLSSLLNFKYITAYLLTFVILAITVMLVYIRQSSMTAIYIRILASGYINAAIYALPVITILLNDPMAAIIGNMLQVIVIQPLFLIGLNAIKHRQKSMGYKIFDIITTPIVVMPLLGMLLNYMQVPLPSPIIDAVTQIGVGASGMALFVFGLTLGATNICLHHLRFDLVFTVFAKNILHPAIAIGVAYFMKLESYWFYSLVIASSAPTALVVYFISKQFSEGEELVKKVIALSSVVSTLSLVAIVMIKS